MSATILLKVKFENSILRNSVSEWLFKWIGVACKNHIALEFCNTERSQTTIIDGKSYKQKFIDLISEDNEVKMFISNSYLSGFSEEFMKTGIWEDYNREQNRKNISRINNLIKSIIKQPGVKNIEIWFDYEGDIFISDSESDYIIKEVKINKFMSVYLDYLETENELGAFIKFVINK